MLAQCGQISFPGKKRKKTLMSYLHPHLSFRWLFPVVAFAGGSKPWLFTCRFLLWFIRYWLIPFPLYTDIGGRPWSVPLDIKKRPLWPQLFFCFCFLTNRPLWPPPPPFFFKVSLLVLLLTVSSALLARSSPRRNSLEECLRFKLWLHKALTL